MADIHQLRAKEPCVWVCDCGCSTFEMLSDGTARCAACEAGHEGVGAGWLDRAAGRATRHAEPDTFSDVQGNGSLDFVRVRMAQKADDKDVSLIVIAYENGNVSAWSTAETPEQVAWVDQKLMQAAGLIARKVCEDG